MTEINPILGAGEYGVVGNVKETDRVFRGGAKVWIAGGTGGEGAHRFEWIGMSRGGRIITKWAPTMRFSNFRAAWIPLHLRDQVRWVRGDRPTMEAYAANLNTWAEEMRAEHPNRRKSGVRA
jgi:hypothetical protein